mmetsp:Transcript_26768/g.103984  ORF Transcript_26768/g.103984 Transcript_26768/m.103984 type:complete len:120 (-) Transcript_26768:993-1352(-)
MDAALSLFGLAQPCQISIALDGAQNRPYVKVLPPNAKGEEKQLPLYGHRDSVSGKVTVSVKEGKALQTLGVRIEFVGTIELCGNAAHVSHPFAASLKPTPPFLFCSDCMTVTKIKSLSL